MENNNKPELQIREMELSVGTTYVLLDTISNINILVSKDDCKNKIASYLLEYLKEGYTLNFYTNE